MQKGEILFEGLSDRFYDISSWCNIDKLIGIENINKKSMIDLHYSESRKR